jgi:corrinoid protein of di/trimethylamine methyltransferase
MTIKIDDTYFDKLAQTVVDCEKDECARLVSDGLSSGMNPLDAVEKGLGVGIKQVGDDFGRGISFLPELIGAADVMKVGVGLLDDAIKASGGVRESKGKVVIGTIKGDIHDIGKSVVAAVMQSNGYDVVDLGIDIDMDTFIDAIKKENPDVLCMSSLLTLTVAYMGEVIEKVKEVGLRDKIKVLVGGCPVTQEFADEIGADDVAFDAQDGIIKLNRLMGHS